LALSIPQLLELAFRGLRRHLFPTFAEILQERVFKAKMMSVKTGSIVPQPATTAKTQLALTPDEEKEWAAQQRSKRRKSALVVANEELEKLSKRKDEDSLGGDALKSAIIRSILRFRNLTGSQFDSAATAKYQHHDSVTTVAEEKGRGMAEPDSEPRTPLY